MNRYRAWCIRQASRANCSPALWALGALIILGVTGYHFRHQIMMAVIAVALIGIVTLGAVMLIAVATNLVRYHNRTVKAEDSAILADRSPAVPAWPHAPALEPADDSAAITADIGILADDTLVMSWTPDGKTLAITKKEATSK